MRVRKLGNEARDNGYEDLYTGALTITVKSFWYMLPGAVTTGRQEAVSYPCATARLHTSGNLVVTNMPDPG